MKKLLIITCISCLTFLAGLLFHAYQKEWIVFLLPIHQTMLDKKVPQESEQFYQKTVVCYFFRHHTWQSEECSIIWSSNISDTIQVITHSWLQLCEDEKIINTDVQIESTTMTQQKQLLISFNKDFLNKQSATYEKLMIIESLLKTIYATKLPVQSVQFLVHHQPMVDDHLNFLIPWPITGYVQIKS